MSDASVKESVTRRDLCIPKLLRSMCSTVRSNVFNALKNASGKESATRRALCIPELLQSIFEFSTVKSNVSNALVCKCWCEEALSIIWRVVEARPLFSLLAPMESPKDIAVLSGYCNDITSPIDSEDDTCSTYRFKRHIQEEDWDRFDRYSWRVQSLRFDTEFEDMVFYRIAAGRRRLDFLPNLKALYEPPPSMSIFPIFAHASVKTLAIRCGPETDLIESLPSRMRHIERLVILSLQRSPGPNTASALRQMHSLSQLTIPVHCLTLGVFHALAFLPNLRSINTGYLAPSYLPLDTIEATVDNLTFPPVPFPSLTELDVGIRFHTAIAWLPLMKHPKSLRILKVNSSKTESTADYIHLINCINVECTGLEKLELARAATQGSAWSERIPLNAESYSIESLTNLTSLTLCAFDMCSFELYRVLEPLSELETLVITGGRKLPLQHLSIIARHSRKLKMLELELEIKTAPVLELFPQDSFANLRILNVGHTPISYSEHAYVADFLSRILRLQCEIAARLSDSTHIWVLVREMVPRLIRARLPDGRKRTGYWSRV